MAYKTRNWAAITLAFVIFGASIASLVVQWYRETDTYSRSKQESTNIVSSQPSSVETFQLNSTTISYTLEGYKKTVTVVTDSTTLASTSVDTYLTFDASAGGSVKKIFKTSQAFVVITLVTSFVLAITLILFQHERVRNWFIFTIGMTATRIVLAFLSFVIFASVVVAFLAFLGLPSAFSSEVSGCNDGPCRAFSDSQTLSTLTETVSSKNYKLTKARSWGPVEGWFIILGCIPVSIILLGIVILNKFPLPIDSEASSGEAL